jgi:glycerol-1-phosphatase
VVRKDRTEPVRSELHTSGPPLTNRYDCAMLDLDGVVYVGDQGVPGVPGVLAEARARGQRLAFVTNNASRTPTDVAARLNRLGVAAQPVDVVTSAQAAARELRRRFPPGTPVLVLGADGLTTAVQQRGLQPVRSSGDDPAAVVQGFGPDIGWRQLADAAVAIRNGALWVATNTDLTIPTSKGLAPGNGALVNALATAVGTGPSVVAGKPFCPLFDETVDRVGSRSPLVVGDRLDTDIEGARRCGADSLLVMTGVTDLQAVCAARPKERPTYIGWTLQGLLDAHVAPQPSGAGWSLGDWTASVAGGVIRIDSSGPDRDAGLRTVVAAAWAAHDADADIRLDGNALAGALGSLA